MSAGWSSLVDLLVCPACRHGLEVLYADGQQGVLGHKGQECWMRYPVIDGIPRLLRGEARSIVVRRHADWFSDPRWRDDFVGWRIAGSTRRPDLRLVERFDREWEEFGDTPIAERAAIFDSYSDIVPASLLGTKPLALDAGCGSGRWADEFSRRGARIVAMDLGMSIEGAARTTAATGNVRCVQADVRDAPIRPDSFDFAYSLGVLHHVNETALALRAIVRTLRPGGHLLLYLYYSLEGRPLWYRVLFRFSDIIRRWLSAMPHPITRLVAVAIAVLIYWPLARLSSLLQKIGLGSIGRALPLSFYRKLSFLTMRNDSLDRFGTSLEKRYTRDAIINLMKDAGLTDVVVSPNAPYWHALGMKSVR